MRKDGYRFGLFLVMILAFALAGCSGKTSTKSAKLDPFAGTGSPYYKGNGKVPKGGGRYHVGRPYQVAGNWFTPKEQPGYDKTGVASWYGEAFHRRKTSNGEWFDMNELTAAHATLPLPSYAKVTNLQNGRQVVVRINDRGPFVGTRIIDLSKRSADVLDFKSRGKANVRVEWIGLAPLNDNGQHLIAMNNALGQGQSKANLVRTARRVTPAEPQLTATTTHSKQQNLIIQVASFADQSNAIAALDMVARYGSSNINTGETDQGRAYFLALGPFRNPVEAQEVLRAVRNDGFLDAMIVVKPIHQVAALQ